MIVIDNIFKSFDDLTVLNGISTQFEKGKTNLIIGQSGSGKTVFLKCMLGLLQIDSGSILFDGLEQKLRGKQLVGYTVAEIKSRISA